jgi:uncharacterized repeat protein (TIGR03803 family)
MYFSATVRWYSRIMPLILVLSCSHHLVKAQSTILLGSASAGGSEFGSLIQYKPGATAFTASANLLGTVGGTPTSSTPVLFNNKLYGTTQVGGVYGLGVIYAYDLGTATYAILHNFTTSTGSSCNVGLTLASNNKLYGATNPESFPGIHKGSVFELDPASGLFTIKCNFTQLDGFRPAGAMLEHNTKLYFMTSNGGGSSSINSGGSIIEYTPGATAYTVRYKYSGSGATWLNGRTPQGAFIKVNNKLYGITNSGAALNRGTVFEYLPGAASITVRANFGTTDHARPLSTLALAADGKLYGISQIGGDSSEGAIFSFDTVTYALSKRYSFRPTQGRAPLAAMVTSTSGLLYGTTNSGGLYEGGVLFHFNHSTSMYTVVHHFATANGSQSQCALRELPSGDFVGTTNAGGAGGNGTLYKFQTVSASYTPYVHFTQADQGAWPTGRFTHATSGRYYLLTQYGGLYNKGAIIEYNRLTNTYIRRASFNDTSGAYPRSTLVQAPNGKLYGIAQYGGSGSALSCAGGCGVLFEFDTTTNLISKKKDFGGSIGDAPVGELVIGGLNKLYGVASISTGVAGSNFGGLIFEYNYATNVLTTKTQLTSTTGDYPQSGLILANNGLMYGVTTANASSAFMGSLYEYNAVTNVLAKKVEFSGVANGANPSGELVQASNTDLYGTTERGGTADLGTVFKYNIATATLTKLVDFTGGNGSLPNSKLVQAIDGKIYGVTSAGGSSGAGIIFQIDLATGSFTKMVDFAPSTGRNPSYGGLVEVPVPCTLPGLATIAASATTICSPAGSSTLSIASGSLNDATTWTWYAGTCNSTPIGTGTSIVVSPTSTTNYFVRGTGGCVVTSPCASKIIVLGTANASTTTIASCSNYVWTNGTTYNNTGIYTQTLTNVSGCDSICTLNFTKLPPLVTNIADTAYLTLGLPWGPTVTSSGTYTHAYVSVFGCDSVVTVDAVVHSGILLSAKVLLAGCYDAGLQLCADSLRAKSLIPLMQPFGTGIYATAFHNVGIGGSEATTSAILTTTGANAIVDWVFIEYRSQSNPAQVVGTRSALLQRDGDVVDIDGVSAVQTNLPPGNYYISIKHRNHLGVMSAAAISFASTGATVCNFTNGSALAYTFSGDKSNGVYGSMATAGTAKLLRAGNCNITSPTLAALISYNASTKSDRHALLLGTSGGGLIDVYSLFDCNMDGNSSYGTVKPDRLVILSAVYNSHTLVLHEQIPD